LRIAAGAVAAGEHDGARLIALASRRISAEPRARLEYIHIVDPLTLDPVDVVNQPAILVAAAWFGDIRLIDNTPLSP
jgi:pantoate--beta-alanine ligase